MGEPGGAIAHRCSEIATGAVRSLTWDYRDRLVRVSDSTGSTTSYTYDVMDRRIAKTVNGVTTRFVYDRDNVLLEFSGSGTATPSTRYLQGAGVDQTLAQEANGSTSWLLTDHEGTTRDLVNGSGTVVNHYSYDSFGNLTSSTANATVDTRYKFTGRELNAETGLYYYRVRYYDAEVGRFIEQDPMGLWAGDSNLYRYVGNEPIKFVDPLGLAKFHGDLETLFNTDDCEQLFRNLERLKDSIKTRSNELSDRKSRGLPIDSGHTGRLASERKASPFHQCLNKSINRNHHHKKLLN